MCVCVCMGEEVECVCRDFPPAVHYFMHSVRHPLLQCSRAHTHTHTHTHTIMRQRKLLSTRIHICILNQPSIFSLTHTHTHTHRLTVTLNYPTVTSIDKLAPPRADATVKSFLHSVSTGVVMPLLQRCSLMSVWCVRAEC